MASNSILRAKANFLRPSESSAPLYVDADDGNKIKCLRGGVGDTAPVTILTSGEDGQEGKVGYGPGDGGTVTQVGSPNTQVTLNKLCGVINTTTFTTPAHGLDAFVVNNTQVAEDDIVILNWIYTGSTGNPYVQANLTGAGTLFAVVVWNYHSTQPLNGSFTIDFALIGGSAS